MVKKQQNRSLRIIGGKWRGRKVSFADRQEIRPTGDRLRETLFNWLMHEMPGASCLDLFAGSGVLGIEALSRDAASVTFVEKDPISARQIKQNLADLGDVPGTVECKDALSWLQTTPPAVTFDFIFLDPPFAAGMIKPALAAILDQHLCNKMVYIETNNITDFDDLPDSWTIHRQKQTGDIYYGLVFAG